MADDPPLMLSGVGQKISNRLKSIGVHTISDLAAVSLPHEHAAQVTTEQVLQCVRRSHSKLTFVTLKQHIMSARAICQDSSETSEVSSNRDAPPTPEAEMGPNDGENENSITQEEESSLSLFADIGSLGDDEI
eukprot:c7873_g1_i3.p1 GENE.c7873_g1_i3~~c7873_g1_i3.p1  ORF type:complete len:133 (+),score=16.86 c7873_g1_i3:136-534(+)